MKSQSTQNFTEWVSVNQGHTPHLRARRQVMSHPPVCLPKVVQDYSLAIGPSRSHDDRGGRIDFRRAINPMFHHEPQEPCHREHRSEGQSWCEASGWRYALDVQSSNVPHPGPARVCAHKVQSVMYTIQSTTGQDVINDRTRCNQRQDKM
jgi:hypothetical protein